RGQPAEIRLNLTEFTFQYGLYERRFAREAAVQGLLTHPKVGRKVVHADSSETVDEKVPPRRSNHLPCNDRSGRRLVWSRNPSRHRNTQETHLVLQVS
ncbi:MAG TPA: hypothetical protein VFL19_01295, partial [Nitrospira sp.]|nr:hypothetical protein [Nitrospira sp.]